MIKTCRFAKEYANYIISRYKEADMPKEQKKAHIKEIESIQAKATKGHITLNEYMQILVDAERYINQYNRYH